MSSRSSGPRNAAGPEPAPSPGRLHVEVPHWAATVKVYDKELRPVADLDIVRESTRAKGVYEAAAEVPPGIYEVEVTLAEHSQHQLVAVYPGETARIASDAWKLEFTSAAPLAGASGSQASHKADAEKWSRRTTWTQGLGGDSRLFLFVRTMKPGRYPNFSDGLYLLDADGRPITDFKQGVHKNPSKGWLAFNAELPAGHYIFRRGRRGVRVRYQPVYLCAGWETQVFMAAGAQPSLRTLTLTMAPLGAGFQADDETTVAAEAILDSVRTTSEGPITSSEKLKMLLRSGRDNPWFRILAAYSLLRWKERLTRQRRWDDDGEVATLLRQVLESLEAVEEHPDARAARLRHDEPAPAPFWQPPLLRVGLVRVQDHATRHADTIPLDSLTDCVLDDLVTNSPWTAWRQLDRLPRPQHAAPAGAAKAQMFDYRAPGTPPLTAAFVQAAAPNAPVYRLGDEPSEGGTAAAAQEPSVPPAPATIDPQLAASVIQAAQALAEAGDSATLPEKLVLDPGRTLDQLLEPVQPEAVSAVSGLPLARTEAGLQQLRRRSESPPSAPGQPPPPLQPTEQVILEYAVKDTAARARTPSDPASDVPSVTGAPPLTGEDLVAILRIEADRLLLRAHDQQWQSDGGDPTAARTLGTRLLRVADELLRRTDFIVLADAEGYLVYGNSPFLDLVSPPVDDPTGRPARQRQQREDRNDNRQAWEAALASTPVGHSTLPAAAPNRVSEEWELWRTVIENDADGRPRAYLNVMRPKDVARLDSGTLERVTALLSELKQFTSLFAYGSGEHRGEYTERLQELAADLERAVDAGSRPGQER
jgi:hypothetical protein